MKIKYLCFSQSSSVYKTANEPGSSISSPGMGNGAKISIKNRQDIKDLAPRKNSGKLPLP